MRNFIKLSCLALGLLSPLAALAGASFAVAPDRVVVNLKQPQTSVFIVKNTGDQLIHLRVRTEFIPSWSHMINAGKSTLTKKQEQATNLMPYIIVSPQALSLEPSQEREVRVSVRTPGNLAAGTYRAHLFVRMLEIASHQKEEKTVNNKRIGIQLNLMMQIATAIYGNEGDNKGKISLSCQTNKQGKLVLHAINKTPWHFYGKISAYPAGLSAKEIKTKKVKPYFTIYEPVFRNSQKTFATKWSVKPGKILLSWHNGDGIGTTQQTTKCNLTG